MQNDDYITLYNRDVSGDILSIRNREIMCDWPSLNDILLLH